MNGGVTTEGPDEKSSLLSRISVRGILMASLPGFIAMALTLILSKVPGLAYFEKIFNVMIDALPVIVAAVAAAGGGFTLHSDRGWHYRTPDWVRACGEAGVERSMSRKGHSPDNAACEGFFGRLKVEFFHGRDWRGVSAARFAAELAEWIRWYREGRLKAFDEGGRKVYDTIAGRRRRLGLAA